MKIFKVKSTYLVLFFVLGLFQTNNAQAEEIIPVPTDPKGAYKAISLEKPTETERLLTVKRSGSLGDVYTKIFIDCVSQTFRVTNEGETLSEMNSRKISDKKMVELVEGSGKFYQVQYACAK